MSGPPAATVAVASAVYGAGVALDDPAETYHEASKLAPSVAAARLPGLLLREHASVLGPTVERAARLHPQRPGLELPRVALPRAGLRDSLEARRSALPVSPTALRLRALAALLDAAYGCRRRPDGLRRRVPSGGALYPLELYPLPLAVRGVPAATYHYDPFRHRLERLDDEDPRERLARALVDPTLASRAAAAIAVTAVFWRSRFKYGQRGYRFALLEAGHVAQNLVLAATALRLSALPVGGFYDRALEELLAVDGVDEAPLYLLLVGGRER